MDSARNLVVAPTQLIRLGVSIVRALKLVFAKLLRILRSKLQKCKFQRLNRDEASNNRVKTLDLI
jgi:hypothetical protein